MKLIYISKLDLIYLKILQLKLDIKQNVKYILMLKMAKLLKLQWLKMILSQFQKFKNIEINKIFIILENFGIN